MRVALFALGMALALPAAALDREGAIEAAKGQVKAQCAAGAACTFNAKLDGNKWYVRVDHPGGRAIFIIDQTGKVVGRMEGK